MTSYPHVKHCYSPNALYGASCDPISGTVAQVLALLPHSKKVMGSIPAWGAVGFGGQVLPSPSVLRWAISQALLCGVCMFSPCSQGVSSTKNPNRKTCRRTELSVPDQDGSLNLVPGRLKAAHCSWGPGGKTVQNGIKAENKFTVTSACV